MRYTALALSLLASLPESGSCQEPAGPPRLVVLIAVDQMRPDYFTRWKDQLTGGLKRLYEGGAFYARGEQDHAITETAPGHATMLSGRSPASTGVVTNELGVTDPEAPLLGMPGPGASPRRFRGTTLYDWMAAADPQTRVLSVSRKDRGAILTIGRARVPVYWYQSGYFTTSTWYTDTLPAWVRTWNGKRRFHALAGQSWDLLLPADRYAEPDSQPWERGGSGIAFPHPFSTDTARVLLEVAAAPAMDALTLDFALEGVKRLGLGKRNGADLLSVALSTTDVVGHVWGPDSRELHDMIIRLDRMLGTFMDDLAKVVPRERIVWVLTSDHGVTSFPEYTRAQGRMAARVSGDTVAFHAESFLSSVHGKPFGIDFTNGLLYGDTVALHQAGVNVDSLASALASSLARLTGVTRIHTPRLLAKAAETDLDAQRWKRTIPPDFAWLAAASLAPGHIWTFSPSTTTHGSSNADDVLVPIVFMGRGIRPGIHTRARTVDIGPTLAALLGVKPLEPVEGKPLPEVIRPGN
jgi:arylsulfatase A-like enzyme